MYNCIIILGTTASGKTKLSVELAKKLNGEIINADSQQIIKGLDIGTAKITKEEMGDIPHHLFNIIEVGQEFSVSEYQELASAKINELIKNNKMPIIVGGTGFYINSLLYNYTFGNADKNDKLRQELEALAQEHGNAYVYDMLQNLDPESAAKLHENDLKRVIRAIEIFKLSGQKKSSQTMTKNSTINPLIIGLNMDRELLYARINNRVDNMILNGLEKEVNELYKNGIYNNQKLANELPIGYSEWYDFYNNNVSKDAVIEKIKQDSRHYAKRQITWFKKVENVNWYNVDDNFNINQMIKDIIIKLKKN